MEKFASFKKAGRKTVKAFGRVKNVDQVEIIIKNIQAIVSGTIRIGPIKGDGRVADDGIARRCHGRRSHTADGIDGQDFFYPESIIVLVGHGEPVCTIIHRRNGGVKVVVGRRCR